MAERASVPEGPRRLLVALYTLLAAAACSRAAVQLGTDARQAPVAYGLSALAGVVYLIGAVLLRKEAAPGWLTLLCSAELVGVLIVGTLSLADPAAFPRSSVWSGFGSGYGGLPLVLPVAALMLLARGRCRRPSDTLVR